MSESYDPTSRASAFSVLLESHARGEIPTGLLYLDETQPDMHDLAKTVETPLAQLPFAELCPGAEALDRLQARWR
jgi:2-oxoglutarate ferredoxin oxidoreductase subunit beta